MKNSLKNINYLVINSRINYLKDVELFVKEIFSREKIDIINFNKVFLCISEAVSNAIIHGNKNQENKSVKIGVELDKNNFIVTIEDEGKGFNYSEIPDPVKQENILKEEGRGLHIIKSYAKKVSFLNNGSVLKIIYDLSAQDSVFS